MRTNMARVVAVLLTLLAAMLPARAASWDQGTPADADVARRITEMLGKPLSADEAVQIALLRNPDVLALYQDVGVAQADVVQAGLLKNPVFEGGVFWPTPQAGRALNTGSSASVSMDFLDVVLRSTRRSLADAQFRQARLRLADGITRLSYEARAAYYTLQGHQQTLAVQRDVVRAADAAVAVAKTQHDAGNLNAVDLARQEAAAGESHLDLERFEAQVAVDRQALARQMGLIGTEDAWTVGARLPDTASAEPSQQALEQAALSQRQDLAAVRLEPEVVERRLALARGSALGSVNLGVSTERDADNFRVTGPTLSIGIPLFDRNQAQVQRLEAEGRRSRLAIAASTQDVLVAVRSERARLMGLRAMLGYYERTLLPLRRRVLKLSLEQYNGMLLGVYALLQARQDEILAHREYLELLRDYHVTRAALERAVGGRMPQKEKP